MEGFQIDTLIDSGNEDIKICMLNLLKDWKPRQKITVKILIQLASMLLNICFARIDLHGVATSFR